MSKTMIKAMRELRDAENYLGRSLLRLLLTWAVVPLVLLVYAYAFRDLWSWYLTPLGLPALGYLHAYGLALTVKLATTVYPTSGVAKELRYTLRQSLVAALVAPVLYWTIGAAVYHWGMR